MAANSPSPRAAPQLLAVHPVLMTSDVRRTLAFFASLGFAQLFVDDAANPRYAGVQRDGVELHLQWNDIPPDPPGQPRDRPSYRLLVRDVDALFAQLQADCPMLLASPQASPWAAPGDTPWGTREFHLRDPDGHSLQFYQPRG